MNELIEINVNAEGKRVVSARELYLGLGLNKAVWSRWYRTNIQENDFFQENVDWIGVQLNVEGNEVQDFAISIEFAKHIAMMSRTEKSHAYRNYFIECEKKIVEQNKPTCIEDVLIRSLEEMKIIKQAAIEAKEEATKSREEIKSMRDVVSISTMKVNWRDECRKLIAKMAKKLGSNKYIADINREIYRLMKIRLKCKLDVQLTNMRKRMASEGVCKSKRDQMNYLDVIARDNRLIEGYVAIVKELAIKYGVA